MINLTNLLLNGWIGLYSMLSTRLTIRGQYFINVDWMQILKYTLILILINF